MCDKVIIESSGTLKYILTTTKIKNSAIKKLIITLMHYNLFLNAISIDTNPPTINYVPECYKTKEMCNKAVHRCFFI